MTGERAEESAARAKYETLERHRAASKKRDVLHWRPIHQWKEADVWSAVRRMRVDPHPCYHAGWGRCSCATCIFGSPNQWASLRLIAPVTFKAIASYEKKFGCTIHRKLDVAARADQGTPYAPLLSDLKRHQKACLSRDRKSAAVLGSKEAWELPAGAFGENAGPS